MWAASGCKVLTGIAATRRLGGVVLLLFLLAADSTALYAHPGANQHRDNARFAPACNHNPLTGDYLHEDLAYTSCFDGPDDDDGDGKPDFLGIPEWVSQEIIGKRVKGESSRRPSKWFLPTALRGAAYAPTDDSYRYAVRPEPDWFDRGHLAQKYLAEKLGPEAAWNTHNLVNAVPQRHSFNAGIWLDLECRTGAWANQDLNRPVWVIAGPIFVGGRARVQQWLGERNELPVAIPDALFKVVIRVDQQGKLRTLSFIYPQQDPSYAKRSTWNHAAKLVSLKRVEDLTGLRFNLRGATSPSDAAATDLWAYKVADLDPGCLKSSKWGASDAKHR